MVTPEKVKYINVQSAQIVKKMTETYHPSKIEWDITNGPLSKLLELLDTGLGVRSVGPVRDFLDTTLQCKLFFLKRFLSKIMKARYAKGRIWENPSHKPPVFL